MGRLNGLDEKRNKSSGPNGDMPDNVKITAIAVCSVGGLGMQCAADLNNYIPVTIICMNIICTNIICANIMARMSLLRT